MHLLNISFLNFKIFEFILCFLKRHINNFKNFEIRLKMYFKEMLSKLLKHYTESVF